MCLVDGKELTAREKQVYEMLAEEGLSLNEIAQRLCISRNTVCTYIRWLFEKFCVSNQKELIIQHYKRLLGEIKH